jgi:hypothetical protein
MRTVNFNKKLVECERLTKVRGYMRYAYKYILCILIHIPTYYLCIIVCYIINYEKFAHSCYQMNTKLKHKELFKLWARRKGEHSNIKSEYFQNSDVSSIRFHENPSSRSQVVPSRLTDGRTDRHDKSKSRFPQFCEPAFKLN